jgi:hypothetical protein
MRLRLRLRSFALTRLRQTSWFVPQTLTVDFPLAGTSAGTHPA